VIVANFNTFSIASVPHKADAPLVIDADAVLPTAANLPWFGTNPSSRATFGLFKTPLIYRGSR
jgi:MSHA biogenesis protein MshQ